MWEAGKRRGGTSYLNGCIFSINKKQGQRVRVMGETVLKVWRKGSIKHVYSFFPMLLGGTSSQDGAPHSPRFWGKWLP